MSKDAYNEYLRVQREATERKMAANTQFAQKENIDFIADVLLSTYPVYTVLCHGVRSGKEVDWFNDFGLPAEGTDLIKSKRIWVVEHDFNKPFSPNFIYNNKIHAIYSNSWDHAYSLNEIFHVWADQGRYMVIDYSSAHGPKAISEVNRHGPTLDALLSILSKSHNFLQMLPAPYLLPALDFHYILFLESKKYA